MSEKEYDFLPNLYLPDQISFDEIMWDEDIPSFIQALTSLDEGSFISNSTTNASATKVSQFYCENKDQDCPNEQYDEGASSPDAASDSSTVKGWEEIPVKQWTCLDVMQWLKYTLIPFGIDPERNVLFENFRTIDGLALSSMTLSDFLTCSSTFGSFLYDKLQTYLRTGSSVSNLYQLLPVQSDYKDVPSDVVSLMLSENQLNLPTCISENFVKPKEEESITEKKKPGRPKGAKRRKQSEQRLGRLWEFIRDLLLSEKYCPKYICWDNYEEGKFRFVESDKVAKLWGSIKGNANMNYEKFSRAMRYYYKSEVLLPVEGRRLVYKFGPKATGWRTNNPNFQL
ncbi:ETS homologous factor-like isoform X2 [Planococcus citri]